MKLTQRLLHAAAVLPLILLSAGALADEAAIRSALARKYPELEIDKVTKTRYAGLYEVYAQDQIVYTDARGSFLFMGRIIDVGSNQDLTFNRRIDLGRVRFGDLPLDLAIRTVKGNGTRKLAVFADPDCPYCKQLEKDLAGITDVTVYIFLYPIETLHANAPAKARAVWCSSDAAASWNELMLNDVVPDATAECDYPVERLAALGKKYRVSGTPTMVLADGRKVPGLVPRQELERLLAESANGGGK
jgi:thiol:disulfide interchange protein DsbC